MEIEKLVEKVKRNTKKIEENRRKIPEGEKREDHPREEPLSREAQEEIARYLGVDGVSNEQIDYAQELLNDIDSWLDENDAVQVDFEQGYHCYLDNDFEGNRTRTITIKINGGAHDTYE